MRDCDTAPQNLTGECRTATMKYCGVLRLVPSTIFELQISFLRHHQRSARLFCAFTYIVVIVQHECRGQHTLQISFPQQHSLSFPPKRKPLYTFKPIDATLTDFNCKTRRRNRFEVPWFSQGKGLLAPYWIELTSANYALTNPNCVRGVTSGLSVLAFILTIIFVPPMVLSI